MTDGLLVFLPYGPDPSGLLLKAEIWRIVSEYLIKIVPCGVCCLVLVYVVAVWYKLIRHFINCVSDRHFIIDDC
jgi:hypothetical protein